MSSIDSFDILGFLPKTMGDVIFSMYQIINVFSQSKGKVSGVVYGGNSRKVRKL